MSCTSLHRTVSGALSQRLQCLSKHSSGQTGLRFFAQQACMACASISAEHAMLLSQDDLRLQIRLTCTCSGTCIVTSVCTYGWQLPLADAALYSQLLRWFWHSRAKIEL